MNRRVLDSLSVRVKSMGVMYRLFKLSQGSFPYKIKTLTKYYPIYIYHSMQQHSTFQTNLNYKHQQQRQQSYKTKIKSIYMNYANSLMNRINSKKDQLQEYKQINRNASVYQKQARNVLHQGMEYLSLYYQSLQSIIQGRRQVLHDEQFTFQDGQSVQQKRLYFEKYLSKLLGRSKQEIQLIEINNRNKQLFNQHENQNQNQQQEQEQIKTQRR